MLNSIAFAGVDAVQSIKKQFVSTFVQNEQISTALNQFIDSQAQYTKDAITENIVVSTKIAEVFTDRTPYIEAAKKVSDLVTPFTEAFVPAKSSKKAK